MERAGKDEFSCVCLHGDRNPQERRSNLDSFKRQRVKFLICTDVAARGLDIHGLPFSNFSVLVAPSLPSFSLLCLALGLPSRTGLWS